MVANIGTTRFQTLLCHFCALAVLISVFPGPVAADEAQDEFNLAVGLYKQKRWDLAAESLRKFTRSYPKHPKLPYAQLYLGLSLVKMDQYQEARQILRDFAAHYPNSRNLPDAMYRVAECSYLLNDFQQCEQEFQAFLKHYPDHELTEWALPYLADSQLRLNDAELAAASFRKSLEQHPKGRMAEDSKYGLARAYELLKQNPQAIELYKELAENETSPRAPQAQLSLATAYYDSQQYIQAARRYVELEKRFPQSPLLAQARLNGGYAYFQARAYREAVVQFDRAAAHPEQAATANYWKGLSHKYLEEFDEASEIFKSVHEANKEGSLAESVVYHWADCQMRAGRYDAARALFLDVVGSWPKGEFADESLHFAAEAALLANQLEQAEALVERFEKEFPGSSVRMHQQLLRGRLFDARGRELNAKGDDDGATKSFDEAARQFEAVLQTSGIEHTKSLARFHLARTLQTKGDHARAIEALKPLVDQLETQGDDSEFVEALLLQGMSYEAVRSDEEAVRALSEYLRLRSKGDQADQALATRALSLARLGRKADVRSDLTTLAVAFPDNPLLAKTTHALAEEAYAMKDWDWAFELFSSLESLGKESPFHSAGLSGQAWSCFQQKNYRQSAVLFERLLAEHPDDEKFAPEAAYMQGMALQEQGQLDEAAAAYIATFRKLAPMDAASNGEKTGKASFAFLSGLQAARVLRSQNKVAEADAAYDELLKRFPKPDDLDKLLDEWALLNYEAGQFERSDEIFRRLVKDSPESDLADNALLSLAESNLVGGNADAARKMFEHLLSGTRADEKVQEIALHHLVGIGVEQRDWSAVEQEAARFVARFPNSPRRAEAEFHLGESQIHQDKLNEAHETLSRLQSQIPPEAETQEWTPRVWVLLAESQVRLKQYDDLRATVDDFSRRHADSPFAYQLDEILGRSYKNQGKFDEARTSFLRVIGDDDGRKTETAAKSQFLIAETYMAQKDYKAAQREYLKVYLLYEYPEWQGISLFQAAQCDEALGQWERAAKAYDDLVRQFPEHEYAAKAKERLEFVRKQLGQDKAA